MNDAKGRVIYADLPLVRDVAQLDPKGYISTCLPCQSREEANEWAIVSRIATMQGGLAGPPRYPCKTATYI